jgi:isopentenyldiphosphate isomerase
MDTEQELLAIFDEKHQKVGENTREFVHIHGLWHETFHCWFVHIEKGVPQLYFQQRSDVKKDFPNLFDITAAGHILAHETVNDGIREVKEELGFNLSMENLHSIGILKDRIIHGEFIDYEFAHTFLYIVENENQPFHLQQEEVAGIFSSPLSEVARLYEEKSDHICLRCLTVKDEEQVEINATLQDFVPHGVGFMEQVLNAIQQKVAVI